MKRFITAIMASAFLLLATSAAYAQRPKSLEENLLLSAVQKYNDKDYDAAREALNEVLQKDQSCDAAWYYLAMTSLATMDLDTA